MVSDFIASITEAVREWKRLRRIRRARASIRLPF
jgi:hypothetical protein